MLAISSPIHPLIDCRDLFHPTPSIFMLQCHYFPMRPVKVIGDEGYLLDQLLEGVA
jgi:hypothetical protein